MWQTWWHRLIGLWRRAPRKDASWKSVSHPRDSVAILGACFPCATMETATLTPSVAELRARLPGLLPRDRRRLSRRLESAAALRNAAARDEAFGQVVAELEAADARVEARRRAVPAVSYPPELPVSQRKDDIAAAIRDHQV